MLPKSTRLPCLSYVFREHLLSELAAYYGKASMDSQDVAATYVISGILKQETRHDEDMDVDAEEQENVDSDGYDDGETEPVTECGFTVVGEGDLECACHMFSYFVVYTNITRTAAKLRYSQVEAIHVYSLSPSPILVRHLCVPCRVRRLAYLSGRRVPLRTN